MMLMLSTANMSWLTRSETPLVVQFDKYLRKRFPKPQVNWFLELPYQNIVPELVDQAYTAESLGMLQGIIWPRWFGIDGQEMTIMSIGLEKYVKAVELAPELPWIPTIWGSNAEEMAWARRLLEAHLDVTDQLVHVRMQWVSRNLETLFDALKPLHSMTLIGSGIETKHFSHAAPWFRYIYTDLWRDDARQGHHPDCTHKSCHNCFVFAEDWRDSWADVAGENQLSLLDP